MAETVPEDVHSTRWPVYTEAARREAADLIWRGRTFDYGRGPEIAAFEDEFADRYGRRRALAVNSGTSALFLAYAALGLGAGDEVVVPDYTFVTTATPLFWVGAIPRPVDGDPDTGNPTAETIEAALTDRTRAVVVNHLFGHPCAMGPIVELCRRRELPLIEDCSHAHGSFDRSGLVGTHGTISVFSTGGLKMVSGGLGGILLTDEDHLHDLACLTSSFQKRPAVDVTDIQLRQLGDVGFGGNLRMSPMAAVLALSHLRALPALIEAKAQAADRLGAELARFPGLSVPDVETDVCLGGRYGVNLRYDENDTDVSRDALITQLQGVGLKITPPRTEPLHRRSIFAGQSPSGEAEIVRRTSGSGFSYSAADFPHTERLAATWLGLPADYLYRLDERLIRHYVDGFSKVYETLQTPAASAGPRS